MGKLALGLQLAKFVAKEGEVNYENTRCDQGGANNEQLASDQFYNSCSNVGLFI
jgi:hypothetical protein